MKISFYGLVFAMWVIGLISYLSDLEIIEDIMIYSFILVFSFLVYIFMVRPLNNYFFGLIGYRVYRISKGKHRPNILPYFKPLILGDVYKFSFDTYADLHNLKMSIQTRTQTNKMFGFNYGLPKLDIKKMKLVHKNSIRFGHTLTDGDFRYCFYIRNGEKIHNLYLKNDIDYILFDTKNGTITVNYLDNTELYFELDNLLDIKKYGYYLSHPYFGGVDPTPTDFRYSYTVIKPK